MSTPSAPPSAGAAGASGNAQDKFASSKATFGGLTVLTMSGTLDHAFEGKKVAEAVGTKKLLVDMREVRRLASWGMSEWMDFLRITAGCDLYLVECSTYAVSQINLVTGLLGHAKLVSFYASYRCSTCSAETESLFVIPTERELIRDLPGSHQACARCGGQALLEEYPAAFFETIATRPSFDIDDEVLAFLRAQLGYQLSPDLTRFRAFRRVQKDYTYVRMSGGLSTLPGEVVAAATTGTTVVDLKDILFDRTQLAPWRAFVDAALPRVASLQLLDCPVGFLEHAVHTRDLETKLKVRSFALAYDCIRCNAPTVHLVDVAEHLEELVAGASPPARCGTCQAMLVAPLSPDQLAIVRALPARERDPALDKLLDKVRREPVDSLQNCLNLPPARQADASRRLLYLGVGLATLLVGGLGVVGYGLWSQKAAATQPPPSTGQVGAGTPTAPVKPAFERPDWIMSDVPSSAFCHDMINRLMCIGVSAYRTTRDEAVAEANDAALEELVSAVGLKITDPFFRDRVLARTSPVRSKVLSDLQANDLDRTSPAYRAADAAVRKGRKRVADILQLSGGGAVPSQRSDWYWEEYAAKAGGTEVLVFVRYDITLDAVKTLVLKYSEPAALLGSTLVTTFPALAWPSPHFIGGPMLTKVGRPLADAGLTPETVISALGDHPVTDTSSLARRLDEWKQGTGDLLLTVVTGDAEPRVVTIPRAKVR